MICCIISISAPIYATDCNIIGGYFQPSGYYGEHSGYYYWLDYCPECHHYNCLALNPKGTVEGEITCMICNADYDGTSGYDKGANGPIGQLIEYVPEPEPVVVENATTEPVPESVMCKQSPMERMFSVYMSHEII